MAICKKCGKFIFLVSTNGLCNNCQIQYAESSTVSVSDGGNAFLLKDSFYSSIKKEYADSLTMISEQVMALDFSAPSFGYPPNSETSNLNDLSGVEFEKFVKNLLECEGFVVHSTKLTGDGGIDLVAINNNVFVSGKYIIQCKRYTGSVGEPFVRDLYGVTMAENANKGLLITTGTFTNSAVNFAMGKPLELIDGQMLSKIVMQNTPDVSRCNHSFTPDFEIGDTLDSRNASEREIEYYQLYEALRSNKDNTHVRNALLDYAWCQIESHFWKYESRMCPWSFMTHKQKALKNAIDLLLYYVNKKEKRFQCVRMQISVERYAHSEISGTPIPV